MRIVISRVKGGWYSAHYGKVFVGYFPTQIGALTAVDDFIHNPTKHSRYAYNS